MPPRMNLNDEQQQLENFWMENKLEINNSCSLLAQLPNNEYRPTAPPSPPKKRSQESSPPRAFNIRSMLIYVLYYHRSSIKVLSMHPINSSFSLVLMIIWHETKTTRMTTMGIAQYPSLNKNQVKLFLLAMTRADETSAARDVEKKKRTSVTFPYWLNAYKWET